MPRRRERSDGGAWEARGLAFRSEETIRAAASSDVMSAVSGEPQRICAAMAAPHPRAGPSRPVARARSAASSAHGIQAAPP